MKDLCKQIRKDILRIAKKSGHGHIPSCFSVVEILVALYSTMKHRPKEPDWAERDLFVLSKGHASLALYCTLARFGYFPIEDVESFGSYGSRFGCHPDRTKVPGVEISCGSLGHGIGIAVGMALALKIQKSKRRVYCLIGDGEANEGSVYEALQVAEKYDNLAVIVDYNGSSHLPFLHADGWAVGDGHDIKRIQNLFDQRLVACLTTKGNGSPTLENDPKAWHRRTPTDAEYETIMRELE